MCRIVFPIKISNLFVLAGLNSIYFKYPSGIGSYTGIYNKLNGMNIGVGCKLGMWNRMDVIPELRYTFGDINYFRFGVKLMFGL